MHRHSATTKWIATAALTFTGVARGQLNPAPASPAPAPTALNSPGTLNFNTGTVDTAALPNLLKQRRTAFRADLHYIIQLDGPMTPAMRQTLGNLGVKLGNYIPAYSYIAQLGDVNHDALAAMAGVRWVGLYQNGWKVEPGLGARPYATAERLAMRDAGQIVVEVILFKNESANEVTKTIEAMGGVTVHRTRTIAGDPVITATVPMSLIARISQINAVQFIEEASEITLRNSTNRWIVQSNATNATPIYDNGIHGEGQIVGVLDGRADQHHCSLDGGKIIAYNTSDGNDTHGTHVSCTAAGDGGVNDNTRGVAYGASICFNTIPSFSETAVEAALNLHHSQGARVHTNSWGDDGTTSYNSLARGFDDFLYQNEDDLVCLAVTNTGTLRNPENAKNLLAVGASQDTPNQASHCSGGTGPTADGRRKPEIYAPGCSTTSASVSACSTTNLTGTSMASPAVAGTGALVRQYYTAGYYPSGAANASDAFIPSGALVKATLLNSAVDMTGITGYPSNSEGWGRVLADNALYFVGDQRKLAVLDDVRNADGLSTGQVLEYPLEVQGSAQRLNITLVFTDVAASAGTGTGFAAVNNLNLEVVSPGGATYLGNVFSGGVSVTGGAADDRNNVEQIQLNSPAIGTWTVRVRGTAVNQGTQGYALIATGQVSPVVPALTMSLPAGYPQQIDSGSSANFDVLIQSGSETLNVASPALFYRYAGGAFTSAPLTPLGGDLYQATLPAPLCADAPQFYVQASSTIGTTLRLPASAPATFYAATVGSTVVPFDDNFQTNLGWAVTNTGGLTGGAWQRGTPVGGGDRGDPPTDADGSGQCYLTANQDGDSDVDGGSTTLTSPAMDASNGQVILSYYRWFSNDSGAGPNTDRFMVEVSDNNGASWSPLETVGPAGQGVSGGWILAEFDLTALGGFNLNAQFRVRFTAEDIGAGSIVEAGVDGVRLAYEFCEDVVPPCPANLTSGDNVVDVFDLFVLLGNWGTNGPGADLDAPTNIIDVFDLFILLGAWGDCE